MKALLKISLVGLALTAMSSATGCMMGEQTGTDPAVDTVAASEGLVISQETETLLTGSYTQGDSLVTFEERLETPILKTKLVVNGAEYLFERDLVKSTIKVEGHGNTVLAADAEILLKMDKAFDSAGEGTQPKMREAMYKTIALMASAPRGTTLKVWEISNEVPKTAELDRGYCDTNDNVFICAKNNNGGCSATYAGTYSGNPIYNAAGTAGTEGGTGQLGGYVTGCTSTPTYTHEHEACEASRDSSGTLDGSNSHGRVTWSRRVGWSAKACQGRCGAGCPRTWNFYVAKDCLDHDVCLDNHPTSATVSTFGTCGNEFDRAATETGTWTTAQYNAACPSVAPMWGDNTR